MPLLLLLLLLLICGSRIGASANNVSDDTASACNAMAIGPVAYAAKDTAIDNGGDTNKQDANSLSNTSLSLLLLLFSLNGYSRVNWYWSTYVHMPDNKSATYVPMVIPAIRLGSDKASGCDEMSALRSSTQRSHR